MSDLLLRVMGSLIKIIYIIPFANFFLLSKRKREFVYDNSYKPLIVGITFAIIHIVLSFVLELLIFYNVIVVSSPDVLSFYEALVNVFLFISSGILLMAMYHENNRRITKNDLMNVIIFILLAVNITAFTNNSLLFIMNMIIYFISIYFLINTFLLTGFFLENYQKDYYLALVGGCILTLEPLIYLTMFSNYYVAFPAVDIFYYYSYAKILVTSVALSILLIPHLRFAMEIRRNKFLPYDKEDSLVENTIKRLFNETQKIFGGATKNVLKNTCMAYKKDFNKKVECDEPFKFKNLNYREQKDYLKILIRMFHKVFSGELSNVLIKKITDDKNDGLIAECSPPKEIV